MFEREREREKKKNERFLHAFVWWWREEEKKPKSFNPCDKEDNGSSTSSGVLRCDVSSRVERRGEASPPGGTICPSKDNEVRQFFSVCASLIVKAVQWRLNLECILVIN